MWDDAHSFKTRSFLCYDSSVSLDEEIRNGCNEQEEFGRVVEQISQNHMQNVNVK